MKLRSKGFRKTLASISFGAVLILLQIWILTNVPEWRDRIIIYMVMTALLFSFGSGRTEKTLLSTSAIKQFPLILIGFFATLLVLYGFGIIFKGDALPTIAEGLTAIPLALMLVHGFIVATDETLAFLGWFADNLRDRGMRETYVAITVNIAFALFHFAISGMVWLLLIPYFILGMLFYALAMRFSPNTLAVAIGCHWAWNVFILGFIQRIGI